MSQSHQSKNINLWAASKGIARLLHWIFAVVHSLQVVAVTNWSTNWRLVVFRLYSYIKARVPRRDVSQVAFDCQLVLCKAIADWLCLLAVLSPSWGTDVAVKMAADCERTQTLSTAISEVITSHHRNNFVCAAVSSNCFTQCDYSIKQ